MFNIRLYEYKSNVKPLNWRVINSPSIFDFNSFNSSAALFFSRSTDGGSGTCLLTFGGGVTGSCAASGCWSSAELAPVYRRWNRSRTVLPTLTRKEFSRALSLPAPLHKSYVKMQDLQTWRMPSASNRRGLFLQGNPQVRSHPQPPSRGLAREYSCSLLGQQYDRGPAHRDSLWCTLIWRLIGHRTVSSFTTRPRPTPSGPW